MTNKQVSILAGAVLALAWYGTRSSKPSSKEVAELAFQLAELAFQLADQIHEWLNDLTGNGQATPNESTKLGEN